MSQLDERLVAVNQRIARGENRHFQIKRKGMHQHWTLQYPPLSEPINHPVFETLRQINISTLLHFVNDHCQFLACFEHVLGRYRKQVADDRVIIACLLAWGTNMGLGRMGEISDIGFDTLSLTSQESIARRIASRLC